MSVFADPQDRPARQAEGRGWYDVEGTDASKQPVAPRGDCVADQSARRLHATMLAYGIHVNK